jgi:hypothetical protein
VDDRYGVSSHETITYTYLPGCVPQRADHDLNADGTIDSTDDWEYDEQGRLVYFDGATYAYDSMGRLDAIGPGAGGESFTYCASAGTKHLRASTGMPRVIWEHTAFASYAYDLDTW